MLHSVFCYNKNSQNVQLMLKGEPPKHSPLMYTHGAWTLNGSIPSSKMRTENGSPSSWTARKSVAMADEIFSLRSSFQWQSTIAPNVKFSSPWRKHPPQRTSPHLEKRNLDMSPYTLQTDSILMYQSWSRLQILARYARHLALNGL